MRIASMLAAAVALWIQPAQAVTFQISGTATGTIGGTEVCDTGYCTVSQPLVHPFGFTVTDENLTVTADIYDFSYGPSFNAGVYTGQFRDLGGGLFQGIVLNFAQVLNGCMPMGTPDCARDASTREFSVVQTDPAPVPEPATWALVLIGFGSIGAGMRRVRTGPSWDRRTSSYSPLPA